eukprot:scaffold2053_cov136-Skeletonema_marinoi.AAC.2
MMTDTYTYRWLDSCLLDSDGRIFLDRDGDAFGDVLRYLRGGKDFLLELMNHLVILMELLLMLVVVIIIIIIIMRLPELLPGRLSQCCTRYTFILPVDWSEIPSTASGRLYLSALYSAISSACT